MHVPPPVYVVYTQLPWVPFPTEQVLDEVAVQVPVHEIPELQAGVGGATV